MKRNNRKTLIAIVAVVLLLLAGGGFYIVNGLRHKPEVFRQILTETVEEDAYELFKADKYFGKYPGLAFYLSNDNLLDRDGALDTSGFTDASKEPSYYQSKVNIMVRDINDYQVGDIIIQEKDPSFGNMSTADVTFVFKWYDFSSVIGKFNQHAYNKLLPYLMVESETEKTFPVIDDLMLSILEEVEAAGMTREYKWTHKYYLSEGGSSSITGKGAHWRYMGTFIYDEIRTTILEELNYADHFQDDPSEEELDERKEIVINMSVAFDLYGKDKTKELLEDLGYEEMVTKMIAEFTPPEENTEQ